MSFCNPTLSHRQKNIIGPINVFWNVVSDKYTYHCIIALKAKKLGAGSRSIFKRRLEISHIIFYVL